MEIAKNADIKNPELLAAIDAMQEDNSKENVDKMVNLVMNSKFISPAKIQPPQNVAKSQNGKTVMQQQRQVQFRLIQNGEQQQYFPAFTDEDEMKKWKGAESDSDMMLVTFEDYANMLADPNSPVSGFVINPFGKSVAFPKNMVMSLMQQLQASKNGGFVKKQFNKDEKLQFSDPEEYPIDMMAAVISLLQDRDDVNSAYLRLFKPESAEKPSYLIILDFSGNMEEIFTAVAKAASPHLDGMQLSMMPYGLDIAQKAVEGVQPFFTKEN
ncbi:MAG: enhanced serine sensitivity protein SseB [Ruminococcus sp.]